MIKRISYKERLCYPRAEDRIPGRANLAGAQKTCFVLVIGEQRCWLVSLGNRWSGVQAGGSRAVSTVAGVQGKSEHVGRQEVFGAHRV